MSETDSVRDLFEAWRAFPSRAGRESFYQVLRSVEAATLLPDRAVLAAQQPENPEALQLLRLWEAWISFLEGHERWGWTVLNEISRSLFFLPEPHTLVGAAALLRDDRGAAIRAFRRGVRVDARYELLYDLLQRYGDRTPPPLNFLPRDHVLNVMLGKARARWRRRQTPEPEVQA